MKQIIRKYRYRTNEECKMINLIPREEMDIKILDLQRSIINLYMIYEDEDEEIDIADD